MAETNVDKNEKITTAKKHRIWFTVLLIIAFISIPFAPKFSLLIGIILLSLCIMAFVPKTSMVPRWVLKLPQANGLHIAVYSLIGFVLIFGGVSREWSTAKQDRIVAEKREKQYEANQMVKEIAEQAETLWEDDLKFLAEDKLRGIDRIQHATNFAPAKRVRSRIANEKVDALVKEAENAMENSDFTLAKQKIQEAVTIPNATELNNLQKLQNQLAIVVDPSRVRISNLLMNMRDEDFSAFQEEGTTPAVLSSDYDSLDRKLFEIAQANVDKVAATREKRRQQRIAQERAAAEAVRRAEQERVEAQREAREARERRLIPLIVESWSWRVEDGYAFVIGEVTNRSTQKIENIDVIISYHTKEGTLVKTDSALVEYNPTLPGQTTPFEVITRYNPRIETAQLNFKHLLFGGTIRYTTR